jgi:RNA polymerase sigma-70 factor, ECF subfamily
MAADDLRLWQAHRADLLRLAYRMLGDLSRAEDVVQEAWLRWSGRDAVVGEPRAFLVSIVTRLCLNELGSARARLEESRSNRLPEPVALAVAGLDYGGQARLESLEQVSMAFLVLLQRLSPAERAVLLLHEVFDFEHAEIAALVGKSEPACRKLLERARQNVASEKRLLATSREEHTRLFEAFVGAAGRGDIAGLVALLSDDAVMIADGGKAGRIIEGIRNLPAPLTGPARIANFISATTKVAANHLVSTVIDCNGQPALLLTRDGEPFGLVLLAVADGKVERVFFHADAERLGHLGVRREP